MTGSIAVDGSFWGGHERGVAVSTRRLWSAMLQRPRTRAVTVFAPAAPACLAGSVSLVPVGPLSGASRFAWQQLALPPLLRARGIDLLHCPCYTAPLGARCRLLVTVHDLIAWTHPALAGWRNALHLRALVGRAIRRAHAIAVPTEVVRRAIIERFGAPSRKIFVVPWGVDAEIVPWRRDEAVLEVRRQFGVDEPFVLFCGCVEPKKNLEAVSRAAADSGLLLLMTGPSPPGSTAALSSSEGRPRRRHLGYVAPATLGALYSAAVGLLLPSHVEGFGMPAVEAMRCGCPVIASDTPALMEVCGGAALHLPAADSVGLTRAIRSVYSDSSLREDLVARGRARAARFTWAAAADRFAEALAHAER